MNQSLPSNIPPHHASGGQPISAQQQSAARHQYQNGYKKRPSNNTHETLAHALLPDIPLLMHGSGDVLPEDVNPHSVATLARLIENYVSSLVGAALDAHDVFTDGEVVGGGACLGVPPFSGGDNAEVDDSEEVVGKSKAHSAKKQKKKRKRVDYWDVPLPPPLTKNRRTSTTSSKNGSDLSDGDDSDDDTPIIGSFRRQASSASMSSINAGNDLTVEGFAPVDLYANERTRNYYVTAPTAMDARSFIFPICHDAFLYQRIKEVQASRRAIGRETVDTTLMDVMKEEGGLIGRWGNADMLDAVLGGRANNDGSNEAADKDKSETNDKTNESKNTEVGAGLLDADVEPSWPGLNALSRGSLW